MGKWSRVINHLRSVGWSSIHRSSPSGQFLDALVRSQQFRQGNDGIVASATQTMLYSETIRNGRWLLKTVTIIFFPIVEPSKSCPCHCVSPANMLSLVGVSGNPYFFERNPFCTENMIRKLQTKCKYTWILAFHCGWTVSIFTSRKDKSYQLLGLINTFTHLSGGCYHGYTEYVNYIGYGHP